MAWQCACPIRQLWRLFARAPSELSRCRTTRSPKRCGTSTLLPTTAPRAPVPRRWLPYARSAVGYKGAGCGHPNRAEHRSRMDAKRVGWDNPGCFRSDWSLTRWNSTMKFYDCTTAPSPRRVRIFLAEKGITVPTVQVDLRNGEQFSPAFRAINPDCTVPVLELDNGTTIADIVGICRYFEELHPEPRLMGRTAEEKALAESWQRRTERDGFYAAMEAFRNSTPGLKGHALPGPDTYEQIPALAERGRARIQHFFSWLDARLSDNEFICGSHFTIADITGMVTIDFCGWTKLTVPEHLTHLRRWHAAVSARPSDKA